MRKLLTRKRLLIGLGAALGVSVLFLLAWMLVAGPIAVLRILRYGDTNIDDYSHYPGRELQPSDDPIRFDAGGGGLELSPQVLTELGAVPDLDQWLESTDSIAFLVVQGDTVRHESYFQGHSASSISQLFSVSKSVTSALIGMAIDDGYLEGASQPITDLVPELAGAGFDQVTLAHLLTMMSGSSYVENDNPFGEHVRLNFTPNLEQQILAFELERPPGELFRYKSGDNALLGLALDRALGAETITEYAQRRLWTPLGMQDRGVWTIDDEPDGLEKTWCCLATSARDLTKLGRLFLQHGSWNGEQLLSTEWVERSTGTRVPAAAWPEDYYAIGWRGYGYQWWLASPAQGDYFALGKDSQFLYANPAADLVIVRLGWSDGGLRSSQWIRLFQAIAEQIGAPNS